jgi:hypothetical protein
MKLILEFDDFNPKAEVNCIGEIQELVYTFPQIKLTMFTSALYERRALFSDPEWCKAVNKLIESNNLKLAIHGLYHTPEEFKHKTKDDALLSITVAESVFKVAGLPFIKVFRGPHWGINEATYEALIDLKYKAVYTHEDYRSLADKFPQIKSVFYNWNLKDNECTAWNGIEPLVIGHGHTHNVCGNGIQESFDRISTFIQRYGPEFAFADEV